MTNVSDYKICKLLIESACRLKGCLFVDLPISFSDKEEDSSLLDNRIVIEKSNNWGETVFRIIRVYFENFEIICNQKLFADDTEKSNVLSCTAIFISNMINDITILPEARSRESHRSALYQNHLVWSIMKDVICPAYQVRINNLPIIYFGSSVLDVSEFIEIPDKEKFIYLNKDVEYVPIRDAFTLLSAIKGHGMDAIEVIRDIINSALNEKIESVLKLAYNDDKRINDFRMLLMTLAGIENKIESIIVDNSKKVEKTAQFTENVSNSWWYFGLVEKMLEPVRGSDWSTYEVLMPWFKEIENKIDDARKVAGRNGLTYESLLRVTSGENRKEDIKLIEVNLASDRIW